jgi:hypothetical protein
MVRTESRVIKSSIKSDALLLKLAAKQELKHALKVPKKAKPQVESELGTVEPAVPPVGTKDANGIQDEELCLWGNTMTTDVTSGETPKDPTEADAEALRANAEENLLPGANSHEGSEASPIAHNSGIGDIEPGKIIVLGGHFESAADGPANGGCESTAPVEKEEPAQSGGANAAADVNGESPSPNEEGGTKDPEKSLMQTGFGDIGMATEKHPIDYLHEPIPEGKAAREHLVECRKAIEGLEAYKAKKSLCRRWMLDRIKGLTEGVEIRLPGRLLSEVLAPLEVDSRELERVVQAALLVADYKLIDNWFGIVAKWLHPLIKDNDKGRAWLKRVVKQKLQKNAGEKV